MSDINHSFDLESISSLGMTTQPGESAGSFMGRLFRMFTSSSESNPPVSAAAAAAFKNHCAFKAFEPLADPQKFKKAYSHYDGNSARSRDEAVEKIVAPAVFADRVFQMTDILPSDHKQLVKNADEFSSLKTKICQLVQSLEFLESVGLPAAAFAALLLPKEEINAAREYYCGCGDNPRLPENETALVNLVLATKLYPGIVDFLPSHVNYFIDAVRIRDRFVGALGDAFHRQWENTIDTPPPSDPIESSDPIKHAVTQALAPAIRRLEAAVETLAEGAFCLEKQQLTVEVTPLSATSFEIKGRFHGKIAGAKAASETMAGDLSFTYACKIDLKEKRPIVAIGALGRLEYSP